MGVLPKQLTLTLSYERGQHDSTSWELPSKFMLFEELQVLWLFSGKCMKDAAGLARGGDETKVWVCIK